MSPYEELASLIGSMRASLDLLELEDALALGHLPALRQVEGELEKLRQQCDPEVLRALGVDVEFLTGGSEEPPAG